MKRVLIFGATSSIAAEVAVLHARRGDRLHLVGRNAGRLAAVRARCEGLGATVTTSIADFDLLHANADVVAAAVATLTDGAPLDTVLIAHGELGDQLATERDFATAEAILRTNFSSVVSLLIPLVNHFEQQRTGSIGVITSVAGDRGRPRNYTYGAAKGALGLYLQGVRTRLHSAGVHVTTLKLGPVDTPMTRDHTKHPLFGKPGAVAVGIVAAMDAGTAEAYVPGFWRVIMPLVKNMPEALIQRLGFLSGR
jgi:decaprenylphospho-beta-D-erythro-pentofuranosid-2-ulose 2-reductase